MELHKSAGLVVRVCLFMTDPHMLPPNASKGSLSWLPSSHAFYRSTLTVSDMLSPVELPGSLACKWNLRDSRVDCSMGSHFIISPSSPRELDSMCNCTWQYRIVHSKLLTISLIEVSCWGFLSKRRMLFHQGLLQVKQLQLSVFRVWK